MNLFGTPRLSFIHLLFVNVMKVGTRESIHFTLVALLTLNVHRAEVTM